MKNESLKEKESLKELLKEGDTIYTVLRSVSRSGMSRAIDCYVFRDNKPLYLSYAIATVLDERQNETGAVKVTGCGMDMGFHLVYNLSSVLYKDGYALHQAWL